MKDVLYIPKAPSRSRAHASLVGAGVGLAVVLVGAGGLMAVFGLDSPHGQQYVQYLLLLVAVVSASLAARAMGSSPLRVLTLALMGLIAAYLAWGIVKEWAPITNASAIRHAHDNAAFLARLVWRRYVAASLFMDAVGAIIGAAFGTD